MTTAQTMLIAFSFLSLGGIIGWLSRGALVREQVEPVEGFRDGEQPR